VTKTLFFIVLLLLVAPVSAAPLVCVPENVTVNASEHAFINCSGIFDIVLTFLPYVRTDNAVDVTGTENGTVTFINLFRGQVFSVPVIVIPPSNAGLTPSVTLAAPPMTKTYYIKLE
jgi:hypothetical protein